MKNADYKRLEAKKNSMRGNELFKAEYSDLRNHTECKVPS